MALPSFLRRKSSASRPPAEATPEAAADGARAQARRRLIGAVVLLGIGVVAFPLLFETEPRPIPVDLPIVIPPRDGAPPLAMPASAPPASTGVAEPAPATAAAPSASSAASPPPAAPVQATVEPEPSAMSAPAPAASAAAEPAAPPTATAAKASPAAPATAAAPPAAGDGARAQALLEGRAVAAAPAGAGRYAVQIGAFAEDKTVREVRAKAREAGLETYTQGITVAAGRVTRVRIGPFPDRKAADAAAAKARAAGFQASVVPL